MTWFVGFHGLGRWSFLKARCASTASRCLHDAIDRGDRLHRVNKALPLCAWMRSLVLSNNLCRHHFERILWGRQLLLHARESHST